MDTHYPQQLPLFPEPSGAGVNYMQLASYGGAAWEMQSAALAFPDAEEPIVVDPRQLQLFESIASGVRHAV